MDVYNAIKNIYLQHHDKIDLNEFPNKLKKPLYIASNYYSCSKHLEKNPKTYDLFMNILNKNSVDHKNFLKAYELFANHEDNIPLIQGISSKTLVMTGSDDPGSTPAMSKKLAKDIPNSSYVEIKSGKQIGRAHV